MSPPSPALDIMRRLKAVGVPAEIVDGQLVVRDGQLFTQDLDGQGVRIIAQWSERPSPFFYA